MQTTLLCYTVCMHSWPPGSHWLTLALWRVEEANTKQAAAKPRPVDRLGATALLFGHEVQPKLFRINDMAEMIIGFQHLNYFATRNATLLNSAVW